MVLQGIDSWLFLQNDTNDVIGQITGKITSDDDFLRKWYNLLLLRKSFFHRKGIKYHYLCIPNKECVYSSYLPEEIKLSQQRPFLSLFEIFDKVMPNEWSYPINELISGDYYSFPKGDTHHNQYGAYLSYKKAMISLGVNKYIGDEDVQFLTTMRSGDLLSKIDKNAKEEFLIAKFNIKSAIEIEHDNGVPNTGKLVVINNPLALNDDTLVFFRDSFGSALIHFLARTFSRVIAVWQPNIDWGILEKENPSFVLSQQVERFTVSIPDDIFGKTNKMIAQSKNINTDVYYQDVF